MLRLRFPFPAKSAALLAAALLLPGHPSAPPQRDSREARRATPVRAAASPAVQGHLAYRFRPGDRLSYALDYACDVSSDFSGLLQPSGRDEPGLARAVQTGVRGELTWTVVDEHFGGALVALRLHQPEVRLRSGGVEAGDEAGMLRASLEREMFVAFSPQGKVLSLRLDPALDPTAQGYARALVGLIQLTVPADPAVSAWQVEEQDPNGESLASYRESTPADGEAAIRTVEKTRLAIRTPVPAHGPSGTGARDLRLRIEPRGQATFRFDTASGGILSLALAASDAFFLAGRPVAHGETTLRLERLARRSLSAEELRGLRERAHLLASRAPEEPLFVPPPEEAGERALQRGELGDASAEAVLAQLDAALAGRGPADDTPLYLKLKALLYLQPEVAPLLGKRLATSPAGGPTFALLAAALAESAAPQAQDALLATLEARRGDVPALVILVPLLGSVRAPSADLVERVEALAFRSDAAELASLAQLTLGTVARHLAVSAPSEARRLVDRVRTEARGAKTPAARRQWILVLGNAGSLRSLADLERFATDPAPEVRSAVAAALVFVESPRADGLLGRLLTADTEPAVRLEAAGALGQRPVTKRTLEAQRAALATEGEAAIRRVLVESLWHAREERPEALALVRRAAQGDPSAEVRRLAAQLLAGEGRRGS